MTRRMRLIAAVGAVSAAIIYIFSGAGAALLGAQAAQAKASLFGPQSHARFSVDGSPSLQPLSDAHGQQFNRVNWPAAPAEKSVENSGGVDLEELRKQWKNYASEVPESTKPRKGAKSAANEM